MNVCVCVCVSRAFIFFFLCLVCLCTQVVTDLSVVSGIPFLEIKPAHNALYTLSVSPWKRGKQTGEFVIFLSVKTFVKTDAYTLILSLLCLC